MQQTSEQKQHNKQPKKGGIFMFQTLKKRIKNEKGLTLIELLAVIVILAIIAAIAVPAIGNIIENTRSKAVIADATNVMNGAKLYFIDNAKEPTFSDKTKNYTDFLESKGKIKSFTVTKGTEGKPSTITFTAEVNGEKDKEFSNVTLDQLSSATVEKGEIKA